MQFVLMVFISWIKSNDCSMLLGLHSMDSIYQEINIQLADSERLPRSTDVIWHPEVFDIQLKNGGSNIFLQLHKNYDINTFVPTHSLTRGKTVERFLQDSEESIFYQDPNTEASFVIQRTEKQYINMFGTFSIKGEDFTVRTTSANLTSIKEIMTVEVTNVTQRHANFDFTEKDANSDEPSNDFQRQKRDIDSNIIELLIVCDYSIYSYWYNQSKKFTPIEKETEAITSIRQYYAFVINGIDAIFKSIQSTFSLSVAFAGIVISQTPEDAGWTEAEKNISVFPNTVDSSKCLSNFGNWIQSNSSDLPGRDHSTLFTRYDLSYNGWLNNTGIVFTNSICKEHSQSIEEDNFDFVMTINLAHLLGHSLGAKHDGDDNTCNETDLYVMAPVDISRVPPDRRMSSNIRHFSICSIDYFASHISSLQSQNDNCMKNLSSSFNSMLYENVLPGQVYDADEQCLHRFGTGSYMCTDQYSNNYSRICSVLWCMDPDKGICQKTLPGDGTLCGNKKWCINGDCKFDERAPVGDVPTLSMTEGNTNLTTLYIVLPLVSIVIVVLVLVTLFIYRRKQKRHSEAPGTNHKNSSGYENVFFTNTNGGHEAQRGNSYETLNEGNFTSHEYTITKHHQMYKNQETVQSKTDLEGNQYEQVCVGNTVCNHY